MIELLSDIVTRGAKAFPDNVAFRWNEDVLTYEHLSDQTAQLATTLQEQGVRPGDRVGIFMRKGLQTPIALYGILRTGAAYVPLDVNAPSDRIAWLIKDCGINVVIVGPSDQRALKKLLPLVDSRLVVIGTEEEDRDQFHFVSWQEVDSAPTHVDTASTKPTDLAYVMYTSGSTGLPKGIMHTHRSGLAYASSAAELYGIQPGDRLSNHSPLHFDMSTFDYFSGPLAGASTVIIPHGVSRIPASMSSLIETQKISVWYSVPFALVQMLEHGLLRERDCSNIRLVLFGGECFPTKHLRSLMTLWPQAEFVNVYGPAEVNQCTHYSVPVSGWSGDQDVVPLGDMWQSASGVVVDERGARVPAGDVGELLVETDTMMEGYWNRPDLTESSIEVWEQEGRDVRYYRTGDLVYHNEDGELVFVGRLDHQIKTRGHRVELTEVEAALLNIDAVLEAAAFPIEDESGTTMISAAVVEGPGLKIDTKELLQHLRKHLASYAVPASVHVVADLPRTGSDKVDRRRLSDMFTDTVLK